MFCSQESASSVPFRNHSSFKATLFLSIFSWKGEMEASTKGTYRKFSSGEFSSGNRKIHQIVLKP